MNLNQNIPCSRKALPFVAMTVAQFMLIGSTTLSKAAMKSGLNQYVFVAYYEALGTLIFLPCFLHHCLRGKRLPLTLSLFFRFFALSLIGYPVFIFSCLLYSFISTDMYFFNLQELPVSDMFICWSQLHRCYRRSFHWQSDPNIYISYCNLFEDGDDGFKEVCRSNKGARNVYSSIRSTCCYSLQRSIWTILQADTAKLYPDEVTIVFLTNLFGTIQTAAASFFLVKRASEWQIHHRIQIIAIVYAGFSLSVLVNTFITWCLRKKGPVFVCMFDPLNVAIAAFMGHVFLGDGVYLGSVVGSATIVVGFYAVIWGQVKTTVAKANEIGGLESSQVTPLLQKLT